jgi:hypothetical protein
MPQKAQAPYTAWDENSLMLTTMAGKTLLCSPLKWNHQIQSLEKQVNYDSGVQMHRAHH